jgi:WD40 repeat-containing protein SMU1
MSKTTKALPSAVSCDAAEVLLLVQQLLREQGLYKSLEALQNETGQGLNAVPDRSGFLAHVTEGRWDAVLPVITHMKLPVDVLTAIYEELLLELLELHEFDTAWALLQGKELTIVREKEPARFQRIAVLLSRRTSAADELYADWSKANRREQVVRLLSEHVREVPDNLLETLLSQALQWQQFQGTLQLDEEETNKGKPDGGRVHLFAAPVVHEGDSSGTAKRSTKQNKSFPVAAPGATVHDAVALGQRIGTVRFGEDVVAECAAFAPDGKSLISGSSEGMVEVWDPATGKLRRDLAYQASAEGELMTHSKGVLSVAVSVDSAMIASGCMGGRIKVWALKSGKCLRKFSRAHAGGVLAVLFSRDSTLVVSGGADSVIRVHGLKSGRMLRELHGHTSFVPTLAWAVPSLGASDAVLVSGSSDGSVRVWDWRTGVQLVEHLQPLGGLVGEAVGVDVVAEVPGMPGKVVVCGRSSNVHMLDVMVAPGGASACADDNTSTVCANLMHSGCVSVRAINLCVSRHGHLIYVAGSEQGANEGGGKGAQNEQHQQQEQSVFCFDITEKMVERRLVKKVRVGTADLVAVHHHPQRNALAIVTTTRDESVQLWSE